MATYDLDQTALDDLLANNYSALGLSGTGAVAISSPTEVTLIDALINSGNYPTPTKDVHSAFQVDNGNSSVNVNLNTIYGGKATGFFLELGTDDTITLTGAYPAVIGTGDGSNKIIDYANSDDTLVGGAGHDTLIGGGASYLIAGSGTNALYGQNNNDTTASDTLQGGSGHDTLQVFSGNNLLIGGTGSESITTGSGDDTIYGMAGSDTITTAAAGHTLIYAGSGPETIHAEQGHDTIYVGYATDYSSGKGGSDTIYAGGADQTEVHVNANFNKNSTAPMTLANGDKLIVFSNGSVTTHIEISGHATIDYLNATKTI